jgi:hypothetical protein
MMRMLSLPAAIALLLGAGAATAQTTVTVTLPCVNQADAEALVTAILPDLIENIGHICERSLPPDALLRQTSGPFIAKYRAEADLAWPRAIAGLGKLAAGATMLLGTDLARPLIGTLLTPTLTRNIQPADCASLERIVTLVQPLPAANTAPLFVQILQFSDAKRKDKGGKPTLPICQATPR